MKKTIKSAKNSVAYILATFPALNFLCFSPLEPFCQIQCSFVSFSVAGLLPLKTFFFFLSYCNTIPKITLGNSHSSREQPVTAPDSIPWKIYLTKSQLKYVTCLTKITIKQIKYKYNYINTNITTEINSYVIP